MENKKNHPPKLKRSMTTGQMEMISLGRAIDVGLFMGSTPTIERTGPSVLLAYMSVELILYIMIRALGEMLYVNPGTGSLADYTTEYISPLAEYLAEWANVLQYVVISISEVVAATEYLKFWWPQVSVFWLGITIIALLLLADLASAKAYRTLEFWSAIIKIITIILMIILGLFVILFDVDNHGKPLGFSDLWSHSRFFTDGAKGFFFSTATIAGSYKGIKLIGILTGEVANPQEAIVKSVKSVLWRILIFYAGAISVIVTIYPWNQLSNIGSPFVRTSTKVGITAAVGIINSVILAAALSGVNSGIYSSSRMLFKLSHEGETPKMFDKLLKHVVPDHVVIGITVGILVGFVLNLIVSTMSKSMGELFVVIYSSSVLPRMVAWFVTLIAELKFRESSTHLMNKHPFKLPLYPCSSYFTSMMLLVIVIFTFISPETKVSVTVGIGVLVLAAIVYAIRHRKKK